RIAFTRDECRGDRAVVPCNDCAHALVDGFAQIVNDGCIAQPESARDRWGLRFDSTEHVAGSTNALEIHVARKIVTTGAQWLQRRRQMRLEFDEAADCRCTPLSYRDAHAIGHHCGRWCIEALDTHHDAIALLAFLADLHKAGE